MVSSEVRYLTTVLIDRVYPAESFSDELCRIAFRSLLTSATFTFSKIELRRIERFVQEPSNEQRDYFKELLSQKLCP